MSSNNEYQDKIDDWVNTILKNPKNLASEIELREQGKLALKYFTESDVDQSQSLSFQELKRLCDQLGLPMGDDEEEALIKMDKDDSGCLDLEEWITWWLNRISTLPNPMKQQEAIAKNTFAKFDTDGSGFLDIGELKGLIEELGASFTEEELEQAQHEIDSDGSGLIEITEFVMWWTNRISGSRNSTSLISLKLRKLAAKAAQIFYTDIFTAIWNNNITLVKSFLESEPRLANASDESEYGEGWTPLHYAAYQGNEALVQLLLDKGAHVNATNNLGFSPLFYASQREHLSIVSLLLENNADPTIVGYHEETDKIFMCPVDHILDNKDLRKLYINHPKCIKPNAMPSNNMEITLDNAGSLQISIANMNYKGVSLLPIKHYKVHLSLLQNTSEDMDENLMNDDYMMDEHGSSPKEKEEKDIDLYLSAPPPPKGMTGHSTTQLQLQTYVNKKWMTLLYYHYFLERMQSLFMIEVTNDALYRLWKSICRYYYAIDTKYRDKVNLEETLLQAIRLEPQDDSNLDILIMKTNIKNLFAAGRGQIGGVTNDAKASEGVSISPRTVKYTKEYIDEVIQSYTHSKVPTAAPDKTSTPVTSSAQAKKESKDSKGTTSQDAKGSQAKGTTPNGRRTSKPNVLERRPTSNILSTTIIVMAKLAAINCLGEGDNSNEVEVLVKFPVPPPLN